MDKNKQSENEESTCTHRAPF